MNDRDHIRQQIQPFIADDWYSPVMAQIAQYQQALQVIRQQRAARKVRRIQR